jgi:hypothetical protein
MDYNFILAVLGLLCTLALGAWSIYLAMRHRYPGQISFVMQGCLGLFDSIVKNLPELSVLYKNAPIKENLVLLKGAFLNSGRIDIADRLVEENLKACLPSGYRWVTARVTSSSPSVKSHVSVDSETELSFYLGLFRRGEYLHFEALAEVPDPPSSIKEKSLQNPGRRLKEALQFSHRIADTGKVTKTSIPRDTPRMRRMLIVCAIYAIVMPLLLLATDWYLKPASIFYLYPTRNGREIEVQVAGKRDGSVKVKGITEEYEEELNFSTFLSRNPKPHLSKTSRIWKDMRVPLLFIILSVVLLAFFYAMELMKARRLRRALNLLETDAANQGAAQDG